MTTRGPHPDFIKAGQIAAKTLEEVAKEVKPGVKILKICTLAERKIVKYGGRPAFPCNVSINEEAAHYTSPYGDNKVFPNTGLVKVDLGANVKGYLSDTAMTIDLDGSYERYVAAADDAIGAAIDIFRPGVKLGDVGQVIEKVITKSGFKPIHELSGHQIEHMKLHAGKIVPNMKMRKSKKIELGEMYAIEPFATNGNGTIKSRQDSYIFSNNMSSKKKLDRLTLQVRNAARRKFGTLPWTPRWLHDGKTDIDAAIHILSRAGVISGYPVLVEGKNGMVSQSEHTVFVGEDGAIVSTLRESR